MVFQFHDTHLDFSKIQITTNPIHQSRAPSSYDEGPIGDTGIMLNPDAPASNYSRGLSGVDQYGNYVVSNISVAAFMFLLLCILVYQIIHVGTAQLRQAVSLGKESDQRYWMRNRSAFWARCKKDLIYAPLWKVRHNRELQISSAVNIGTLPGRLHALILMFYVVSNLAYCLALDWSQDAITITAQLRGRSGGLAALNIIPTVLFALRNNPLIWLTRISYDSFNLMHRWAARLVIIESTIHTICWAVNNIRSGGTDQVDASLSSSISYQWGMVAMCTFCVIVLASVSPVRHAFYDVFLAGHRILVLLALVGVYVHLHRAGLPQLPYIQLVFVFWGAELALRYSRMWYFSYNRRRGLTQITVEALAGDACRVTFSLRRPWTYRPGCYVHAYLPTIAWWSSHPFSVAWAEKQQNSPARQMVVEMDQLRPRNELLNEAQRSLPMLSRKSTTSVMVPSEAAAHTKQWVSSDALVDKISLVCRARAGFTQQLFQKAMNSPGKKFSTFGLIEGPYGGHESFASYGTVVLFAGGVGITHCLGYAQHLLELYQEGQCATQRVLLVWSVPNTECLDWIRPWIDRLLRMECRRELLRILLYITKPRTKTEIISSTGSVQMFPGRCDPKALLQQEMAQRIGAMAVTVCGPGAFADSVRAATRPHVTEGYVDFVEEAFTY